MLFHCVGERHLQISISRTTESFRKVWQEPQSAVASALLPSGLYYLESGPRQMDHWPCVCFPGSCFPTALANLDQVISRSDSLHWTLSTDRCSYPHGFLVIIVRTQKSRGKRSFLSSSAWYPSTHLKQVWLCVGAAGPIFHKALNAMWALRSAFCNGLGSLKIS